MRVAPLLILASAGLELGDASAADLQVAVLFDTGLSDVRWQRQGKSGWSRHEVRALPDRVRNEIVALEEALRAEGANLELAIVTCVESPLDLHHLGLDPTLTNLAASLDAMLAASKPCSLGADAIEYAVRTLEWKREAEKRILIVSQFGGFEMSGRTTAEEAVHQADRADIVVHAIEFFVLSPRGKNEHAVEALAEELRSFLDRPTAPLGRVPSLTRHATLLSGGTYLVGPASSRDPRKIVPIGRRKPLLIPRDPRRRMEWLRSGIDRESADDYRARLAKLSAAEQSYAEKANGRDGLDDLADGVRRPSEVQQYELPAQLQRIDLEPLLDAVWNYVDARRVIARLVRESNKLVERPSAKGGALGLELGKAMLGPSRLPPSRR